MPTSAPASAGASLMPSPTIPPMQLYRAPDTAARRVVPGHFASRLETTWASRVGPASRWMGSRGTAAVSPSPGYFG
ncbi:hypothetical protein WME73_07045 [Sorangium sp. So ce302]|uniref:hypothetical protein n=1 Tax=Sorangium sp. So ce302 TaxID=3133297 RepID=UPI003F5E7BB3